MKKEFGGHLELELPYGHEYYLGSEYCVRRYNSGRSAICMAIIDSGARRVWLPIYYCNSVEQAIMANIGNIIEICFYNLDSNYMPQNIDMRAGDIVVWCNYYGIFDSKVKCLKDLYGSIIVDNCQAFFYPPLEGAYNVYSCRKFFGVSDGAYLISDSFLHEEKNLRESNTLESMKHLLIPYEESTDAGYSLSIHNEKRLGEEGICHMSKLTQRILSSIDYEVVKSRRKANYQLIHQVLGGRNCFPFLELKKGEVPLVYPFYYEDLNIREALLGEKIYVSSWWPSVLESNISNDYEKKLAKYLCPIPIDQRNSDDDICELAELVLKHL